MMIIQENQTSSVLTDLEPIALAVKELDDETLCALAKVCIDPRHDAMNELLDG